MSQSIHSTSQHTQLFEKYVVDKEYHLSKMDECGEAIQLSDKAGKRLLDSDFFAGSVAISRDTNHVGIHHKLIFAGQWLHRLINRRSRAVDPNLCHGMLVLKQGVKSRAALQHPFLIAHACDQGVRTANRDCLREKDVTQLILYRPLDADVRALCTEYGERTAFVEKKEQRTFFAPEKKTPFSNLGLISALFRNKRHSMCGKNGPIDADVMERTAYLVTDFLFQTQLKDRQGNLRGQFCSSYVTSALQGVLFLDGLKKHKIGEIARFIQDNGGCQSSRDSVAKKVYDCLLKEPIEEHDPVGHSLWVAYRRNKITQYDSQYAMSAYVARVLDTLSVPAHGVLS